MGGTEYDVGRGPGVGVAAWERFVCEQGFAGVVSAECAAIEFCSHQQWRSGYLGR